MPPGSVAPNAFAGFTSPAGTVFTSSDWGAPNTKYLAAYDSNNLVATTAANYSNVEVTTWSRYGIVFLRLASGTAVYFLTFLEAANGYFEMGIVTGLTTGPLQANGTFNALYSNGNLAGTVAGYTSSATAGARFSFGASGLDIYAKFNGVEFARVRDYRQPLTGRVAMQANTGYGFRDVNLVNLAAPFLFSDPANKIIDLRDFGLKSIRTTGSMAAGSNQLTLPASAGFAVGDPIIVAVGGEAGAGARGAAGVGGTWPAKSYASVSAMNADSSRPAGTFAWVIATGDVYQWQSPSWTIRTIPYPDEWYTLRAVPRALVARVTAVNGPGTVLTLNTSASAATTAAAVYFDNMPAMNLILGDGLPNLALVPAGWTARMPAGSFAVSDQVQLFNKTGWTFYGASKDTSIIVSPNGVPSANFSVQNSPSTVVHDFGLLGNARQVGYGLAWGLNNPQITETSVAQGFVFPGGVVFEFSNNCDAHDLVVTDVFQKAVGTRFCDNVTASRCKAVMTDTLREYVQWHFQWTDGVGGSCTDCEIDSRYLLHGFEGFKTKNFQIIRPVSRNATFSMNGSGGFLIQDAKLTVDAGAHFNDNAFNILEVLMNINNNINDPTYTSLGGTIKNAVLLQRGYINANNDTLRGIVVQTPNPNITVDGGSYTAPDWSAPASQCGPWGLDSDGTNTTFKNFTVVGVIRPNFGCPNVSISPGKGGTITNVTAGVITGP